MRLLLSFIAIVVSGATAVGALFIATPARVADVHTHTQSLLTSEAHAVARGVEAWQQRLLGDVQAAALSGQLGAVVDTLSPSAPTPAPNKRRPKPAAAPTAPDATTLEQANAALAALLDASVAGQGAWAVLVSRKGTVLASRGGPAVGAELNTTASVRDALQGISRFDAESLSSPESADGKPQTVWLFVAPTAGKDGAANGALVVGRPLSEALCAALGLNDAFALDYEGARACVANGFTAPSRAGIVPQPSSAAMPPVFVAPDAMGTMVHADVVPSIKGAVVYVAQDLRPALDALTEWQELTGGVVIIGVLPMLVLLTLMGMAGARPAHAIANHLALLHQGGKPPTLQERKFHGGFKRVVKNLNSLLERQQKPQSTLQPISALLSTSNDADGDLKFEPASGGSVAQAPPFAPATVSSGSGAVVLPPLAPPAAAEPLGLFDEDKTQISARPPQPTHAEEPIGQLPPLLETPPPPSRGVQNVSPDEADNALKDLSLEGKEQSEDTPWDTAPPATQPPPAVIPQMPPVPSDPAEEEGLENLPNTHELKSASLSGDPDDAHFQEVFEQFIKVREQCGEPTASLTYDKFVDKLKKTREQVMAKQNTRSVRFAVYVKDGKAALKAVAAR